jgi:tRNA-dihydrouridine synthase
MNQALAKEIINSVRSGVKNIPVSVKTRIGYNSIITDEWIPFLLAQKVAALTIHGRTAKEKSDTPARWNEIAKAVEYKNKISPETVIIGNGDITSYEQALSMNKLHRVDGLMIARGIFSNPWVFDRSVKEKAHSKEEYLDVLKRHLQIYEENVENSNNFAALKKFFKMYINNFYGASEFRQTLMEAKSLKEVKQILFNE